jgi:hypothetical protein
VIPFLMPPSTITRSTNSMLREANTRDRQFYFYFGQPRRYGRLHLRTDGDRPYVFIDYWLNPSGSRNLEYDASKTVSNP